MASQGGNLLIIIEQEFNVILCVCHFMTKTLKKSEN